MQSRRDRSREGGEEGTNIETNNEDENDVNDPLIDISGETDNEENANEDLPPDENPETVTDPNGGQTTPPSGNNSSQGGTQTSSKPYKDPSISSYWSKLEATAKSGQSYYSEYYTKTRLITKNGYLYNYAASTQITTDYLVSEGRLSSSSTSSNISVMLMYGKNISTYGGSSVYITSTDREFTVFAFMKHPNENKYIFTSANGSYGTMSESAYNSLMAAYSMNHGTVRRLTPSNSEYDRILSCIKMYESKYEQYFVRSITVDDKYAFVVLSGRSNAATIREYILRYDNGIWEVVMDDLESEGRLPVTVSLDLLDKEALIRILTEPKSAIVKQYQKLLELDGVKLEFDKDALTAIAETTLARKTGARGLRAIMENIMMDTMFQVPSDETIKECRITKEAVLGTGSPLYLRDGEERRSFLTSESA